MVLKSDGNSEFWSKACYLILLRHLIRSRAARNRIFQIFFLIFHPFATCFDLPSYISNMEQTERSIQEII